jgi:hypothetical protein
VVNIDKNKYLEEEKSIQLSESKNDLALTLQRILRGRAV